MQVRLSGEFSHWQKNWLVFPALVFLALLLALLGGCGLYQEEPLERAEVEYTIVREEDIPEKLQKMIEQKKETEFKITFEDGDGFYMAHGYGEQETGGYSIAVREVSMTEQALYFDTELLGPEHGTNPQKKPSYPYIVVKTTKQNQNIVFE